MTLVRRFPARIVKAERATDVVCPMHDALSAAQRANLLLENPLSYLNVTRSTLDMPGASYEEIGAVNAAGLERLLRSGSYGDLLDPGIYVYRIDRDGDVHTGVVADLDVSGFVDGRVLGHEDVKPEKVEALAKHFEAVPTRSELVAVMHQDDDQAAAVVAATTARPPILTVTDLTGVEQQVWRVDRTGTDLLIERLSALRHYVADGHHRVAATVARWRDHGSPRGGTVLCVLYPESQTHLMAFDRLVAGPIDADDLLAGLRRRRRGHRGRRPHQESRRLRTAPGGPLVPGAAAQPADTERRRASPPWTSHALMPSCCVRCSASVRAMTG